MKNGNLLETCGGAILILGMVLAGGWFLLWVSVWSLVPVPVLKLKVWVLGSLPNTRNNDQKPKPHNIDFEMKAWF